ncbi:hypothetical protein J6590_006419 [Homalodisca vitripennis]|nr:hypothetical protein J6590_006419 [Homalodisca vitripennis]
MTHGMIPIATIVDSGLQGRKMTHGMIPIATIVDRGRMEWYPLQQSWIVSRCGLQGRKRTQGMVPIATIADSQPLWFKGRKRTME